MVEKMCICTLAGSDHKPWCAYFEPIPMPTAPNGESWSKFDNPNRIAHQYLESMKKLGLSIYPVRKTVG